MKFYSTIPTTEQLNLLVRVKEMPGLRNFPITSLAKMQDVTQEEALGLNNLCMQTKTPVFTWDPPLDAEAMRTPEPSATPPGPPPESPPESSL